ncbi:hypothetical protein DPMN_081977 [Dreissena polymorpha]|uniref:Uncharacterized protein n=1 Tax=Dreissena polymorpha TaxID=45954 RepID=A0A9D4BGU2_DREPO|nr:hypothetical protein DPMN_081977 [Dreissena polymorpha]
MAAFLFSSTCETGYGSVSTVVKCRLCSETRKQNEEQRLPHVCPCKPTLPQCYISA